MIELLDSNPKIAVVGLGYVGLPLAVEFSKSYEVLGYDLDKARVASLQAGNDTTLELSNEELRAAKSLNYSTNPNDLRNADIYIVTVPTPVDITKQPDLTSLISASKTVGLSLKKDNIVIYESTVYPGATEEICVPILEKESGLSFNVDFFCGYSPERINPGDREHRLIDIKKITSGSTSQVAKVVDRLYSSIIKAGTHSAPSIRIAEAAKVIENTQRDLNIALMNELAIIFNKMDLDTDEVLKAAATKWNFLHFRPGLVGGHCIGVDPYYLTHKAEMLGYNPKVILAGRNINDGMGTYVATRLTRSMIERDIPVAESRILVLGLTFKENCPDLRNTRVIDIITELQSYNVYVDVYDPWVKPDDAYKEYGIKVSASSTNNYDGVVLAVAHEVFVRMGPEAIRNFGKNSHIFFDVKSVFEKGQRFAALNKLFRAILLVLNRRFKSNDRNRYNFGWRTWYQTSFN